MRVLIATIGSLGDIHPMMGLSEALTARGHSVVLATSPIHQDYIQKAGIEFRSLRPEVSPDDPKLKAAFRDPFQGAKILTKEIIFPGTPDMLNDLMPLAQNADVIVSSVLCHAGPIAAHIFKIPCVSSLLSPMLMWSGYDPPIMAPMPAIGKMRFLPPSFHSTLLRTTFAMIESWADPLMKLRAKHGLPKRDPFIGIHFSKDLNLGHWWEGFGPRQPDWPTNMETTGFIFYDAKAREPLASPLENFLASGPAPLVLTLGSTIVEDAHLFMDTFLETVERTKMRAVITVGAKLLPEYAPQSNDQIHFCDYAPYETLFPRSAIIVHQGGVGTTAQALKSGRPMVILPHVTDQFDNAFRVVRLGAGAEVPRRKLTAKTLSRAILELRDRSKSSPQKTMAEAIQKQDGAKIAAETLEKAFGSRSTGP